MRERVVTTRSWAWLMAHGGKECRQDKVDGGMGSWADGGTGSDEIACVVLRQYGFEQFVVPRYMRRVGRLIYTRYVDGGARPRGYIVPIFVAWTQCFAWSQMSETSSARDHATTKDIPKTKTTAKGGRSESRLSRGRNSNDTKTGKMLT
jgi:hypothetical protein